MVIGGDTVPYSFWTYVAKRACEELAIICANEGHYGPETAEEWLEDFRSEFVHNNPPTWSKIKPRG